MFGAGTAVANATFAKREVARVTKPTKVRAGSGASGPWELRAHPDLQKGDDGMVRRRVFPADGGYEIEVATEKMRDGMWASVATLTHSTESSERVIDLPAHGAHFETEEAAERFAVGIAREWIERNVPASL